MSGTEYWGTQSGGANNRQGWPLDHECRGPNTGGPKVVDRIENYNFHIDHVNIQDCLIISNFKFQNL